MSPNNTLNESETEKLCSAHSDTKYGKIIVETQQQTLVVIASFLFIETENTE